MYVVPPNKVRVKHSERVFCKELVYMKKNSNRNVDSKHTSSYTLNISINI